MHDGTKHKTNFEEAKLLSKRVISCERLSRMAEEAFVIGYLHLDNLCSDNVIFVKCGQIQKIGWESKPNQEILCILQILKLQQMTISWFQINGHITNAYLKSICAKTMAKTVLLSFLSKYSQYLLIQTQDDF